MTEKEKMLTGKLYFAGEEELAQMHMDAMAKCHKLNLLDPRDMVSASELLSSLIGSMGNQGHITSPFYCDYGCHIHIGDYFYSNYNLTILDCAPVTIGNHVMIGPNVGIYTAGHPIDFELREQELEYAFPVTIGDHVWIGGNVCIMPDVTIGNNVVIGAGSVVTKNIPDNVIAVGNPCKVLREITEQDKKYYFKGYSVE